MQKRARQIKRRLRAVQMFPCEKSPHRVVGAVMCDQAEMWPASEYFSEKKMAEMHDMPLRKGATVGS